MKLNNRTILVTGGAGFIGSHLVETLAAGNRVIAYDNFSSSVMSVDGFKQKNIRVIKGDILNAQTLTRAMAGVDVVFHLAVACVRLSLSRPTYVHDVNATGTLQTLLAAKTSGVKRFIYISSSEAYGTAKKRLISETHPIDPTTVYGMSKYMGELYTIYFNDHEQLPAMVIRPFNTYGPRSHFEGVYGEVIPRFVVRAINNKQPTIFGDGTQSRDFTYVTDTVDGIIRAGANDSLLGNAVNIARGQEVSIYTIAKTVCKLTHIPFHPVMKPERPNDVARHAADIAKARKTLSYHPRIPTTEGLRRYIDWVRETYPNSKQLLKKIPDTNW